MNTRFVCIAALLSAACTTTPPATTASFDAAASRLAAPDTDAPPPGAGSSAEAYIEYALRHRPELRASLERWRAASARVGTVDTLGPLEVGYGAVLLRGGTQRHQASVMQPLGWPGKAKRAEEALRESARATGVQYDAELVEVRFQVLDALWRAWAAEEERRWLRQHEEIARQLAASIRGRVEVGQASLADVTQAELLVSRTADRIARAAQQRERALLELARVAGVEPGAVTSVPPATPRPRLPVMDDAELALAAQAHPRVAQSAAQRDAIAAQRASVRTRRYPNVGVGAEWMEMAPGVSHDGSPSGGKDSVMAMVSLMIPLWNGEVRATEEVLDAESAALDAGELATRRDVETAVRQTLSDLRDSARRVRLYEGTLVPQAEAALGSVRGAYEVGQGGVAALLLAQAELLQLRLQLVMVNAEHERQWAQLERLVAGPVAAQEAP